MNLENENTKLNEIEIAALKKALADELINGGFEIIPFNNMESRNWHIFNNGVFRNTKTHEYFQLNDYGAENGNGSWKKVRTIVENDDGKLIFQAMYTLKAILNGNIFHFGRIELEIDKIESEDNFSILVEYDDSIENDYLKTSSTFGIISAMEGMRLYQPQKGVFKIKVISIGFHEIDSSSITIAYVANMCVLRALDIEKRASSTFRYVNGKFEIFKKYPIKSNFQIG